MDHPTRHTPRPARMALALLLVVALVAASGALILAAPSTAQPEAPTLTWTQINNVPGVFWYTVNEKAEGIADEAKSPTVMLRYCATTMSVEFAAD